MSPHLVYYQLVILGLLWLCVMLPSLWPSPPGGATKTLTKSIQSKRKRSTAPKAFEGLTQKPHCALCEQETGETAPAPPRRPAPLPPTNRRPRTVDTSMHFCPHPECAYRGWLGLHNLRANGPPGGFLCDVHVEQLQLDELYAVLRDRKAGASSDEEAIQRLERSPYWVWTAMAPQSKSLSEKWSA
jgi:hypothetical protein